MGGRPAFLAGRPTFFTAFAFVAFATLGAAFFGVEASPLVLAAPRVFPSDVLFLCASKALISAEAWPRLVLGSQVASLRG
jgi:hypothetical protein